MSVNHYVCNDMRKILINIIEIHMNVRCAEMRSRKTVCYLCFNSFSPHLKYVKYLSGLRVMETQF
jgi:hypothetical protein